MSKNDYWDYLGNSGMYDDYLAHYGILGMKWGHRKDKNSGEKRLGFFARRKQRKLEKRREEERLAELRKKDEERYRLGKLEYKEGKEKFKKIKSQQYNSALTDSVINSWWESDFRDPKYDFGSDNYGKIDAIFNAYVKSGRWCNGGKDHLTRDEIDDAAQSGWHDFIGNGDKYKQYANKLAADMGIEAYAKPNPEYNKDDDWSPKNIYKIRYKYR